MLIKRQHDHGRSPKCEPPEEVVTMGGKRQGWDKLTAQFDWSQRSGSMPQVEVQVGAVFNGRYGSAPEVRCLETSKVQIHCSSG